MKTIDLRSDTITLPTPEMRLAMAEAELGDDVYGEDPTVNELEAEAAVVLGKKAGLFTASGTMGNLTALMSHANPGDEVLLDQEAHIYYYEVGGLCRVAGLVPNLIAGDRGLISAEQLQKSLRPENIHFPAPKLLCMENTHNRAGGRVLPQDAVLETAQAARDAGLAVHLDGARLFNAAAASGSTAKELAAPFDSVMICLSKGLAAPMGSVLAGSAAFIERARKNRKLLGGGMRQAGVAAAAGLWALRNMTERLHDDHRRAQGLAERLTVHGAVALAQPVETNMLYLTVRGSAVDWVQSLQEHGVLSNAVGPNLLRFVTHWQLDDADMEWVEAAVFHTASECG